MEKKETNLCIIENADLTSNGTSLEREMRSVFGKYDSMLVEEERLEQLKDMLQKEAELLLEQHKNWKRVNVCLIKQPWSRFFRITCGSAIMKITPSKYIVFPE